MLDLQKVNELQRQIAKERAHHLEEALAGCKTDELRVTTRQVMHLAWRVEALERVLAGRAG